MKLNTFKKYFLMISVLFLVCITFIMSTLVFLTNNYLADEKYKTLTTVCEAVTRYSLVDYRSSGYVRNIYNISRAIATTESNTVIVVLDKNASAICCTCEEFNLGGKCQHAKNSYPADFIKRAEAGTVNEVTRLGSVFNDIHYLSANAITDLVDNSRIGYVFAATPASGFSDFLKDILKIYLFSAIVPVVIMFFVLYYMTHRWNKPLILMSKAAKSMAKGDFSNRIPITSDDEIGQLAKSFNQMTNSLVELENMRRGFIANVSHELRTPMTTIGGFIDGIIDGTIEKDKQEYYLKIVSAEIKRLSRLVQGMLSLSKLEARETKINPASFDFSKLLLDIVISQEKRIESKNLNIIGLDEIESYTLYADRDLIYQAVFNLCDNAIKFTNENGNITFKLKRMGNMLQFSITNSGEGINEKDLPFIFERFYKGDKARSQVKDSTGLGLYLVKTIIKIHGGKVFVQSEEGKYTQFGFSLPLENI